MVVGRGVLLSFSLKRVREFRRCCLGWELVSFFTGFCYGVFVGG